MAYTVLAWCGGVYMYMTTDIYWVVSWHFQLHCGMCDPSIISGGWLNINCTFNKAKILRTRVNLNYFNLEFEVCFIKMQVYGTLWINLRKKQTFKFLLQYFTVFYSCYRIYIYISWLPVGLFDWILQSPLSFSHHHSLPRIRPTHHTPGSSIPGQRTKHCWRQKHKLACKLTCWKTSPEYTLAGVYGKCVL